MIVAFMMLGSYGNGGIKNGSPPPPPPPQPPPFNSSHKWEECYFKGIVSAHKVGIITTFPI